MIIESSAPGKLILFGEHASSRGKPAIVFAVNQRLTVRISPCKEHRILITSKEFNAYKVEYPSTQLDLVTNILSTFFSKLFPMEKPIDIVIESDIKPGFGSSAAVIVALFGALNTYFNVNLTNLQLLKVCTDFDYAMKGFGSGLDIAASITGGLIKYQKNQKPEILPHKHLNLIIGNTGIKTQSGPIVMAVREFEYRNPIEASKIFTNISEIVSSAEDAILKENNQILGSLMTKNHELLKQLDVSSPILDEMVQKSLQAGALGAKLSGAGKGDNMIALVTNISRNNIIDAIHTTKGKALPNITIDENGLQIKEIDI